MEKTADVLRLENQLCFPLYAASRLVTGCYQPLLTVMGLTYPQYLVLLVLWENDKVNLSFIAGRLRLESNTLTPVLKRMEKLGLLRRARSAEDERSVVLSLTRKGKSLREKALSLPRSLAGELELTEQEGRQLHGLLWKLLK
jgi:DNA-binding MarR family transcriptional regulator